MASTQQELAQFLALDRACSANDEYLVRILCDPRKCSWGSKLQPVEPSPSDVCNVRKSITGSHDPSALHRQWKPATPAHTLPSPPLGLVPFDIVVPSTVEDTPAPTTAQHTVRHMRPLSPPLLRNARGHVDTSRGISSLAPLGITVPIISLSPQWWRC